MSEKLLELSSVVNVLSRTVGDLENQRQAHELRNQVTNALLHALLTTLPDAQRAEVGRSFRAQAQLLGQGATASGKAALKRAIAEAERLFFELG